MYVLITMISRISLLLLVSYVYLLAILNAYIVKKIDYFYLFAYFMSKYGILL